MWIERWSQKQGTVDRKKERKKKGSVAEEVSVKIKEVFK